MRMFLAILIIPVILGGCATLGASPTSLAPVCEALIGPIKYNTYKKTSQRYAAPQLAPDLKQRNQVGQYLGCPAYKR